MLRHGVCRRMGSTTTRRGHSTPHRRAGCHRAGCHRARCHCAGCHRAGCHCAGCHRAGYRRARATAHARTHRSCRDTTPAWCAHRCAPTVLPTRAPTRCHAARRSDRSGACRGGRECFGDTFGRRSGDARRGTVHRRAPSNPSLSTAHRRTGHGGCPLRLCSGRVTVPHRRDRCSAGKGELSNEGVFQRTVTIAPATRRGVGG